MTEFFRVSHDSFDTRGFPWIQSSVSGLEAGPACSTCGVSSDYPTGDVRVRLKKKPAKFWPDVLGCGAYPLFIVSGRVLDAWEKHGVEAPVGGRILIEPPLPRGLTLEAMPPYYWIDGKKCFGAKLDFDASGFVGVRFCPECGRRTDDISATYDRRQSATWPYVFREGTWTGLDLFTTDLSPTAFFCTEKLVDLAAQFRFTNFRFVPTKSGAYGEPIAYLRRRRK